MKRLLYSKIAVEDLQGILDFIAKDKALAMANGCMLQALAATHPQPDRLPLAFDAQSAKFLDALADRQFRGAVEMQVKDLRKHIPAGKAK